MLQLSFEAKTYIFQKYFMTYLKIFIRLDGRAKKACPATLCGPCSQLTELKQDDTTV